MRGYHAVGISYALDEANGNMTEYLMKSWLFAIVIMFVFCLIVYISESIRNMEWILCCIVLIEFCLGMHAGNHYVYPSNTSNHMDIVVTDTIRENVKEEDNIVFITDDRNPYMDFLQMQLREYSLHIVSVEDAELINKVQMADYLIVYKDIEPVCDYDNYFSKQRISNQYILYYDTKEEY